MKWLNKTIVLFVCTLTLSGCNPDLLVSQTPHMGDFIGKTPQQIIKQGQQAIENNQYSRAIGAFRAFIKLYPDDNEIENVRLKLIQCYSARGQFKEALKEIEIFKSLYPNSNYYDNLKKKETFLRRKDAMDRFYHLAWLKDIKAKNKTSYRGLIKRIDQKKQ